MNAEQQTSVSILGLGYVGAVTAACLADRGFRVLGVDVNRQKVDMINQGSTPIVEEKIGSLIFTGHLVRPGVQRRQRKEILSF